MKQPTKKTDGMEHPMPCAKCGQVFDAWGFTLHQRERRQVRCMVCRETAVLKGLSEVPWLSRENGEGEA